MVYIMQKSRPKYREGGVAKGSSGFTIIEPILDSDKAPKRVG